MRETRQRAVLVAVAMKWLAIIGGVGAPLVVTSGAQRVALVVVAVIGAVLRADDRYPWLTLIGSVAAASVAVSAAASSGGPSSLAYVAILLIAADTAVQRGGGASRIVLVAQVG